MNRIDRRPARRIASRLGLGLLVLALAGLLLAPVGCGGRRGSSITDPGAGSDTPASPESDVAGDPLTLDESQDLEPEDAAKIAEAATDLHEKIVAANSSGQIALPEGAALSLGVIATADEEGAGTDNQAGYVADQILMAMTQHADAPYTVVADTEAREKLVEQRSSELTDLFNTDTLSDSMGQQIGTNLALAVQVRTVDGETEEFTAKLYVVGTGALLFGKPYRYASRYGEFVAKAEAAEQSGNPEDALDYYELANASRRERAPRARRLVSKLREALPPARRTALLKSAEILKRAEATYRALFARARRARTPKEIETLLRELEQLLKRAKDAQRVRRFWGAEVVRRIAKLHGSIKRELEARRRAQPARRPALPRPRAVRPR